MPATKISCPNCRQPVTAEIIQLFDVGADPRAKEMLLSGAVNVVQCPFCGYQGSLATPVVYHDPDKELLLTYVPQEMALPRNEQERLIGQLINQAINQLPQEKRKGYLLRPQAALTMQGLIERVLEGDGITKEMILAQQQRIRLVQRLMTAPNDTLDGIIQEESQYLDQDFFSILSRLAESSASAGDETSTRRLVELQELLLSKTEYGQQLQAQRNEIEAAIQTLREAGTELTREKLLDLLIQTENETRLSALISLARNGLDYAFFQLLSERIDISQGEEKERLASLREKILEMTREIDQQLQQRLELSRKNLEMLLTAPDLRQATLQNLPAIDDYFVEVLNREIEAARTNSDLDRSAKLNEILRVLQEASAPPELGLIEELISIEDDEELNQKLEQIQEQITPEVMDLLTNIVSQTQSESADAELASRVQKVYRYALKTVMQANIKK